MTINIINESNFDYYYIRNLESYYLDIDSDIN